MSDPSMNGSRQWRWKRKRGRNHQQRAASRSHLGEVQRRLNSCHGDEDAVLPLTPRQASSKTWGTLSLRDHLAAGAYQPRQHVGSLARPMRSGPYSRALHSRRVTGVLVAVLGESQPDADTLDAIAVILGDEARAVGRRAVFHVRLRDWLRPYFADHPEMNARLHSWLRMRLGDEGERTA